MGAASAAGQATSLEALWVVTIMLAVLVAVLVMFAQMNRRQQRAAAARAAAAAAVTDGKLNQIHTLVNSDMTAARQSELDQTRAMVIILKRVLALAAARGEKPNIADVAALERTQDRVEELEQILADRLSQFRLAEDQIAEAAGKATETEGNG